MIEYLEIYKSFDAPVLSGVSLTINTGERMALVGTSGTGKSVLLKTTIGLMIPDYGDVQIDGESVFFGPKGSLDKIRRKVGYVFQNAALFDSMTILENVAYGLRDEILRVLSSAEIIRHVNHSLEEVNLDPHLVLYKKPAELSGGMRKRVGLARALVGHPEILLYDEPVTGLDPINLAAVSNLIEQIAKNMGVTSILVTHDIEGALALSDRVALLDRGRIHFVGTPDQFRRSQQPLVHAFANRQAASKMAQEMMMEQPL